MGLFILLAPFLVGFALCISDGNADLPQHLLVDLADRCSQRPDGGRGVEIKDRHEIFAVEVASVSYTHLSGDLIHIAALGKHIGGFLRVRCG